MEAPIASRRPAAPSVPFLHSKTLMLVCGALLASYLWLALTSWANGHFLMGAGHGTVGYDFSCFWGSGKLALQGSPAAAYDWSTLKQLLDQELAFDQDPLQPAVPFFYPPFFFLVLAPLALLPFPAAVAAWAAIKLAAYTAAIRAILPGATAMMTALAAPVVIIDVWIGQNGLLTAALLGGALATLDRRPLVSGMLMGLLVYKPHFGVLLPLVLAITGRWRVFGSAAVTVVVLVGITGMIFGWDVFAVAAQAMMSANRYHLVAGDTPWFKLQTRYGALRAAGLGSAPAWSAHIAVAGAATVATVWIWRGEASYALKAASLSTAALLLPPYLAIYDLPILAVPMAFLVRDALEAGLQRWHALALALALVGIFMLEYAFPEANEPVGPIASVTLAAIIAARLAARLSAGDPPVQRQLVPS